MPAKADDAPAPISPDELKYIHATLEQYLTRIQSYHLKYTDDDFANSSGKGFVRVRSELKEILTSGDSVRFTSQSLLSEAHEPLTDAPKDRSYYHNGRATFIKGNGFVEMNDVGAPSPGKVPYLLQTIGIVIPLCQQTRLSDWLTEPAKVFKYGTEKLLDRDVVVLGIGPPLPAESNQTVNPLAPWIKLWLSTHDQYCPLKLVIYHEAHDKMLSRLPDIQVTRCSSPRGELKNYMLSTFEVLELGVALDNSRMAEVPFPKKVRVRAGALIESTCHSATINPVTTGSEFEPAVSKDATLIVNGEVDFRNVSGNGIKQARKENVKLVQRMLSEEVQVGPSESTVFSTWPWWLVAAGFGGLLLWNARRMKQ